MSCDEALAARLRELLPDATEKRMFGGVAFLVDGALTVAASGQGGLLVRVDPARAEALLAEGGVGPMEMRGRELRGWLRVGGEALEPLERWVAEARQWSAETSATTATAGTVAPTTSRRVSAGRTS